MKIPVKNILFYLLIIIFSIFWPISFVKANWDWMAYLLPALVVIVDYLLCIKKSKLQNWVVLLIPFLQPSLSLIPLFIGIWVVVKEKFSKLSVVYLMLALILVSTNWKQFSVNSVINIRENDIQTIERQRLPYENKFLGKIFQNKATVVSKKYFDNLFLIIDPNNYFFALHPREIAIDNQNLTKFPFVAIIFFIVGIYSLLNKKDIYNNWIIKIGLSVTLALSFLNNIDKYDIILIWPIILICVLGISRIRSSTFFLPVSIGFIFISFFELVRIILL